MLKMHTEMLVGFYVKCLLLLSDFNKNWNVLTILLVPVPPTSKHEKLFSGPQVVTCGQTQRHSEATKHIF
jgi:hypothetical protein